MQKHTKTYLHYFDYGEQDRILCEACHREAVDIHHIHGWGKGKDIIENLIALCRKCHERAHSTGDYVSPDEFQYIHNNFLNGNRKRFLK